MNKNKKNIRMSSTGDNCNSCGGELKYYPYEENLRCIRCGNVYEFKKSKDKKPKRIKVPLIAL